MASPVGKIKRKANFLVKATKFPVQPVEMQMAHAFQIENFPEQMDDLEVLHFFRSNLLERKLPFHLHKISISAARESAPLTPISCAFTIYQ